MKKIFNILLFTFIFTFINVNIISAQVYVLENESVNIEETPNPSIKLNKHELSLNKGETITLTVSFIDLENKNLSWISSDNNIAIVENGKITARSKGSAVITVSTTDGKYKDNCTVVVNDTTKEQPKQTEQQDTTIKIKSLMLSKNSILMTEGDTATLRINVSPSNATEKVIWKSSKDTIATVKDGVITAKKAGQVEIIASSESGSVITKCKVKVEKKVVVKPDDLQSISFEKTTVMLKVGETLTLQPILKPVNAKTNLIWNSSNKDIVSVNNGVITANQKGTSVVKVYEKNKKEIKANVTVIVSDGLKEEKDEQEVELREIRINKKSMTMYEGDIRELVIAVEPVGASEEGLVWKSSDETVAIVENGIVKALKSGYAKITISNEDGTISQTCNVKVLKLEDNDIEREYKINIIIVVAGCLVMVILLIVLCILNNRKK